MILGGPTKVHIESFSKAIAAFSAVYLAMRWAEKSSPSYDKILVGFGAVGAILAGL